MNRCHLLLGLVPALFAAATAFAQDEPASAYPSKPLTIVVPYAAGGGTDLLARTWAEVLRKELGQPVVVENKPGGNGIIGTAFVAKSPADGYTLYIATYGFPVTPLLVKDAQYAVKDFAPIIRTGSTPLGLVVAPESPYKSVADLVAAAKAKPGALNTGTLGDGSQEQMGSQKLQSAAGVKFTEVPYKGGAPAITDLLGGSIQLMVEGLPTVLTYIKSGKLRALGITGMQRSSQLPDVPTIEEQGVKGVDVLAWTGFLAPAKTPRPIIDKLNAAFRKGLADPAIVGKIAQQFGSDPVGGSPDDFAAFIEARTKENALLISALGIKQQ